MNKTAVKKTLALAAALLPLAAVAATAALFVRKRTVQKTDIVGGAVITESAQQKSCLGAQCLRCPYRCFLPEGAVGVCNMRINSGDEVKLVKAGRLDEPAAVLSSSASGGTQVQKKRA